MKRFWMILIFLGLLTPVFAMSNMPSSMGENLSNKKAPSFTLETTDGKTLSLTQAMEGKRTALIFWATWCPHCREELETLRQKLDGIKQKGIQILLLNVGESKEDAKGYLKQQGVPLESFLDEDNTVAGLYGVVGIPTVIFIDDQGIIRSIEHEFPTDYDTKFASK
jgi:peroxiredoxin